MRSLPSSVGKKLYVWMLVELRVHAIDAADTLNEASRIPRNVVVDDHVGAVEVHAFGKHFRADQNPVVVARVECVGVEVGDHGFVRRFVRLPVNSR